MDSSEFSGEDWESNWPLKPLTRAEAADVVSCHPEAFALAAATTAPVSDISGPAVRRNSPNFPKSSFPSWISILLTRGLSLLVTVACGTQSASLSAAQRKAIANEIETEVRSAYDLSVPGAEQRMLALYVDTGRIVSASGGRVIASRDTLTKGIELFWQNVGVNMRQPKWIWTNMYVDVLSPQSAVFTGTYRVPHMTPRGEPHEIAGAMTLVFAKRSGKWGVVQEHLSDLPPVEMNMDSTHTRTDSMPMNGAHSEPRK